MPQTQEEIDAAPTEVTKGMASYNLPGKPGDTPNWHNQLAAAGADNMISFSPFDYVHMLEGIPTFVAYGSNAVTGPGAQKLYDKIDAPKELSVVEGAGHFDLYWKSEYVDPTVDHISNFLKG